MQVTLVMFKADGQRRDFPLSKSPTVIGRKRECDLRVPVPSVSRQHCQIEYGGGKVMIRDLGSSNGTVVNDKKIDQAQIHAGDRITLGPVHLVVTVDGKPAKINAVPTVLAPAVAEAEEQAAEALAKHDSGEQPLLMEEDDQIDDDIAVAVAADNAEDEEMAIEVAEDENDPVELGQGAEDEAVVFDEDDIDFSDEESPADSDAMAIAEAEAELDDGAVEADDEEELTLGDDADDADEIDLGGDDVELSEEDIEIDLSGGDDEAVELSDEAIDDEDDEAPVFESDDEDEELMPAASAEESEEIQLEGSVEIETNEPTPQPKASLADEDDEEDPFADLALDALDDEEGGDDELAELAEAFPDDEEEDR